MQAAYTRTGEMSRQAICSLSTPKTQIRGFELEGLWGSA